MARRTGGLSATRLSRMHGVMTGHVERGEMPGLVTLISRRGEVHIDAIGTKATGDTDPMQRNTIFRITSMTKPIIAAATMILVEECKIRLEESVDRLLPELADRTVLTRPDGPLDETTPAHRPITVRDLLTFRMGFGIVLAPPEAYPIQRAMRDQELGIGPPKPRTPHSPDEWMRRLGTLPLLHQPGEQWLYDTPADVLGVLIARAAGQSLETFLHERIFTPLGMKDTGFSVPADKLDRLASCYDADLDTSALVLHDSAEDSQWSSQPPSPSGAGGLVSTVDDYLAFGAMMLNKGMHGHERILSRLSVEVMTTDQLTTAQKETAGMFLGENRGWGFGMSVITKRDDLSSVPGRFGWDGGYGTSWYADPAEEMVCILMTQVRGFPSGIYSDFWTSAYQAIDD